MTNLVTLETTCLNQHHNQYTLVLSISFKALFKYSSSIEICYERLFHIHSTVRCCYSRCLRSYRPAAGSLLVIQRRRGRTGLILSFNVLAWLYCAVTAAKSILWHLCMHSIMADRSKSSQGRSTPTYADQPVCKARKTSLISIYIEYQYSIDLSIDVTLHHFLSDPENET